ncbi:MAG TPA: choice-of-anchor K domain-containing protein [Fimbriimonadaceae bacterium]|nr:choice-of-anchor K domain-containing protein [Fimbriimonadaceae bacterium]
MRWTRFSLISMLAVAAGAVQADPVQGTATGTFVNPLPGSATTTGTGTSNFTWGNGAPFGSQPNRFQFTGDAFNTTTGTSFRIGTLYYFNGTIASGTQADSVTLRAALNFTDPALGLRTFDFGLTMVSTPNTTGTQVGDADYVFMPSSVPSQSVVIGSTEYTLQFMGFQNINGSGLISGSGTQLHVFEQGSATADVYARLIERSLVAVPGPAATLPFALGLLARRRKRSNKA